jgi:hypothetical protein
VNLPALEDYEQPPTKVKGKVIRSSAPAARDLDRKICDHADPRLN